MNRAYAILDIKAVDDDQRIIEGIASTPSPDRMGDVVEPLGAQYKLPMPLLWQHDSRQPIGEVFFAKPTKNGIPFKAKLAKIDEPGNLKDRLDEAWQSIKIGLVRAVSIGFRSIEHSVMENGGWRFLEWEWLELSAVTIPAQAEATIDRIRSIDTEQRAASGRKLDGAERPTPPAPRHSATKVVKAEEPHTMKKTIPEQIAAFEATRQSKSARMDEIMDAAAEKGETLDAAQKEEFDTLQCEVKEIDEHLVRLRDREKVLKEKAAEVKGGNGDDASKSRDGGNGVGIVKVGNSNLPKGTAFTRMVLAKLRGHILSVPAYDVAKQTKEWHDTPQVETVLRAAVAAGSTTDSTWAGPLVEAQNMASEFAELLRPLTIIGRIDGFRRVPFDIKVPRQTGGATVNWVGEGKVKPVSALAFDQISLGQFKVSGIVPLTQELVMRSSPSAEAIVRQDLAAAVAAFLDSEFIDPTKAEAAAVSPASVTYQAAAVTASGTSADALRTDIKSLLATFITASIPISGAVWIMSQTQALAISMMTDALGQPEFPGITMNGGTLYGIPVVTSESVPSVGNSPTDGSRIILMVPREVMLADEGGIMIDVSREASLQMDSAPDSPVGASTVMVSLWQHGMIGVKVDRFINWKKRRDEAVNYINGTKYVDS